MADKSNKQFSQEPLLEDGNILNYFFHEKEVLTKKRNKGIHLYDVALAAIYAGDYAPRRDARGKYKTALSHEEFENQQLVDNFKEHKIPLWQTFYEQKEELVNRCCFFMKDHGYHVSAKLIKGLEDFKTRLGCWTSPVRAEAYRRYQNNRLDRQ